MVITHSLKQAPKVRNLNTIVWSAIYYFQIAKKPQRDTLCILQEAQERPIRWLRQARQIPQNEHKCHI